MQTEETKFLNSQVHVHVRTFDMRSYKTAVKLLHYRPWQTRWNKHFTEYKVRGTLRLNKGCCLLEITCVGKGRGCNIDDSMGASRLLRNDRYLSTILHCGKSHMKCNLHYIISGAGLWKPIFIEKCITPGKSIIFSDILAWVQSNYLYLCCNHCVKPCKNSYCEC